MEERTKTMDIDIVITWVDGNDDKWVREKNNYSPDKGTDARLNRYREIGTLKYWFRGVEEFAPWCRKIHFVTWGHIPDWLRTDNPKLNIVKHSDFIPEDYLPTFSAHPIELNFHRIPGLSENFIYFNDDMFLINPVREEDFFRDGIPLDSAVLDAIAPHDLFCHILANDIELINKSFSKHDVIKKNVFKWFNYKYGKLLYRSFVLLPWQKFTGIYNPHLSLSLKKSTYIEVWEKHFEKLDNSCRNRFRSASDVNAWIFRYWQLMKGEFYPQKEFGKHYNVINLNDLRYLRKDFQQKEMKVLCLNDSFDPTEYESARRYILEIFDEFLPRKSTYEL